MKQKNYPAGWDEERVLEVLAHYEDQTENEQFAAIEASLESENVTLMAIPKELVPQVQALLSRSQQGV